MKIVFLTRLYWPHVGGVEKHVGEVVGELVKKHQVTVATEQYAADLPLEETVGGARVLRIPVAGVGERDKKWHIWRWIWAQRSILNEADLIHAHDVVFWLYAYKLARPVRRIYATFHGWEGLYPLPTKNILQRRLDAQATTGNICVGDYIAKWYGIKPSLVTYGAASPLHPRGGVAPAAHPGGEKILLFLGRLEENTGWLECLNKYRRLKDKLGWQLVVAGDGSLRHLAPRQARLLGFVSDARPYIAAARYVFTTGYLGIAEAFAAGQIVLSHYENPLKKDYLLGHPMAKYLIFSDNLPERLPREPQLWASRQTWAKLAQNYHDLWAK